MPRQRRDSKERPLPTIWRVSDELWAKIEPILAEHDPPKRMGRPRIDQRRALNGIIYRLRSGVQWNELPKEFGDDSSVHRTFQRWVTLEVFDCIWATLLADLEDAAADACHYEEAGLCDQVKVLVGGAPVTEAFAQQIGDDGFAPNAAAVRKAKEIPGVV